MQVQLPPSLTNSRILPCTEISELADYPNGYGSYVSAARFRLFVLASSIPPDGGIGTTVRTCFSPCIDQD